MSTRLKYSLIHHDGNARAGILNLAGQQIETPIFMPVGTNGTVKAITVNELKEIGYQLILGNTYHLSLRPGDETVKKLGGLHHFMNWDRGILTDSGGFQVFSLGKLNKITRDGVFFQSHLDGQKISLTPERSIEIQENLNSNIMMVLDECLGLPADREKVQKSIELTTHWAQRSFDARKSENNLFGIVQGANYDDLRIESAQALMEIDFDGYAIGGLSVGESKDIMYRITNLIAPILPTYKPRYLMGVGDPVDLLEAVGSGIDMFDCVMATRNARNGSLFTFDGKISIKQSKYKEDHLPIEASCQCEVCQNYSRGYLRHLYQANEILSSRLNSYHNLYFFKKLMEKAREAILQNRYLSFKKDFLAQYLP
ncbi:MAG: tRNA guanosine(34) transglycosylase Tgt [Deltaproteobacteria bacterium]|jgi:queuine tRNA-ribosyltransferase|nr:tRNA guanosine(34) transglycosylase Tgt [Deltaproteobacteria bacterium]